MLAFPVPSQCFQMISRRRSQDVQLGGRMNLKKFPQRYPLKCSEAAGVMILKKLLRLLAAKGPDHTYSVLRKTLYAKRPALGSCSCSLFHC